MSLTWQDVGRAVQSVAPVVGGILGGPAGSTAAAGVANLLASWLGCEPTPDAVLQAVQSDEARVRLRELEVQERGRLLDWQSRDMEMRLENLKSARSTQLGLAQASHGSAWAAPVISSIITIGFFAMLGLVLYLPGEVGQAGLLLLGSLAAAFAAVCNYYLGSSLGSKNKEQALVSLPAKLRAIQEDAPWTWDRFIEAHPEVIHGQKGKGDG